jgi:hypothetical protein
MSGLFGEAMSSLMRPGTAIAALVAIAIAAPIGVRAEPVAESARFEAPYGIDHGRFGGALAIDGDRAFVSGYEFDDDGQRMGAVNEFIWTENGWTRGDRLRSTRSWDSFGTAVAVDGDLLAVGAPGYCSLGDDSTPGRVDLFRWTDGAWQHEATIERSSCIWFGGSLDVAGGVLAVGSSFDHGGAIGAFVYERVDGAWAQTAFIEPTEGHGDSFGSRVATDGTHVLVGDRDRGRVHVYERADATWARTASLSAPDDEPYNDFGGSVAIDAGTAVVGAPYADGGAVEAAYVFDAAEGWALDATLVATDGAAGDDLGWSVAIDGDAIALGARSATVDGASQAGAVYLFERPQGAWEQTTRFEASDAAEGMALGWDVSIGGRRVLSSSAARGTACGEEAGVAYLFDPAATGEIQTVAGECVVPPNRQGPTTTVASQAVAPPPIGEGTIAGESIGHAAPVASVAVTLEHATGGIRGTYEAELACVGLRCTWSLDPPGDVPPLNAYRVVAQGTDELGNVGPPSERTLVLVAGYD